MTPDEHRAAYERCVASGTHRDGEHAGSCLVCGYHSEDWPSVETVLERFEGRAVDTRGRLADEINGELAAAGLWWPQVKGFTDQGEYILTARGEALGDNNRTWSGGDDPVKGFARLHDRQGGRAGSDSALVKASRVWGDGWLTSRSSAGRRRAGYRPRRAAGSRRLTSWSAGRGQPLTTNAYTDGCPAIPVRSPRPSPAEAISTRLQSRSRTRTGAGPSPIRATVGARRGLSGRLPRLRRP